MSGGGRSLVLGVGVALAGALVVALTVLWTYTRTLAEMDGALGQKVSMSRALFMSQIRGLALNSVMVSRNRDVTGLLLNPSDPQRLAEANHHLSVHNDTAGALTTYVMDASGLTLASSN